MPPKKRPYVRKTKGCYPCARRRIHCDRTEPRCQKCAGRGLECTGLGLRLRFPYGPPSHRQGEASFTVSTGSPNESGNRAEEIPNKPSDLLATDTIDPSILDNSWEPLLEEPENLPTFDDSVDVTKLMEWVPVESSRKPDDNALDENTAGLDAEAFGFGDLGKMISLHNFPPFTLFTPMPELIPRWKRNMCLHFSQRIATEMTAIDGMHNGWRHLVLPMTSNNELVLNAVVTVSLYHIAFNQFARNDASSNTNEASAATSLVRDPNEMYNRVISGLRNQPKLNTCDNKTKTSILVTILVLFVGAMVTGRTDFPLLARMMESAIEAVGGEDCLPENDVATFIKQQIHKIRLYAAPLLDEQKGAEVISSQYYTQLLLSSLTDQLSISPQYGQTVLLVRDIVQQAIDLYLEQVRLDRFGRSHLSNMDMVSSVIRVQHFKESLESFPAGVPGQSVLIWATFVAASGSVLDEHKQYFEQAFLEHHKRSGFINLLEGLEYLKRIWERSSNERWTSLLAQANILVM